MSNMVSQITDNSIVCSTIIQIDNKENINALHYWLIVELGNRPMTGGFSSQRASNA